MILTIGMLIGLAAFVIYIFGSSNQEDMQEFPSWSNDKNWIVYEPKGHTNTSKFVYLPDHESDINVSGTSHKNLECRKVIEFFESGKVSVYLERRPNPVNATKKAIAVIFESSIAHETAHIGWIPQDTVDFIALRYTAKMPIGAELGKFGKHKTGEAFFFTIRILIPQKADRAQFERKR